MSNKNKKICEMKIILILAICRICSARIHNLKLENDGRRQINLSTFGFLRGGYLALKIKEFSIVPGPDRLTGMYGFTIDKTISTGISPYLDGKQESCVLDENSFKNDDSVSVVFFQMDFANKKIKISHKGDDLKYLNISCLSEEEYTKHKIKPRDVLSDTYLINSRAKRESNNKLEAKAASDETEKSHSMRKTEIPTTKSAKTTTTLKKTTTLKTTTALKTTKTHKMASTQKPTEVPDSLRTPSTASKSDSTNASPKSNTTTNKNNTLPSAIQTADLKLVNDSIQMQSKSGKYSAHFLVIINLPEEEGLYNLYFHNCPQSIVNLTVSLTENNNGNYLSAGEMPLPTLYVALSCVYLLTGGYWFYILRSSEGVTVFKTHYLMLVLLFVKAIALFFHSINYYFIKKEGHHEEAFAILYYITHLTKGALLFVTIVLIGAGWAFVKHILSDRDKKIFIIVIPLQVLANVAQIIIEETEEGQSQYTTWKEVFILVDLLCCGAILFPVVWSIRHLQEASSTDGKAAINLAKLKIFRHFYIMIVCYIYFTRIIVYLLKITVPFQYEWLDELFKEIATYIFFVVTGYKFRPASNNPYLQVSTESDEEVEMDEVLTKSGALSDVVRVNVKNNTDTSASLPAKRESSHDYD